MPLKTTVFVYENQVWQLEGDTFEATGEERVPEADYPVEVYVTLTQATDDWDSPSAVLKPLLKGQGELLEAYAHDVGHDDTTTALHVRANTEACLRRLLNHFEEVCKERPEPL